MQTTPAPLATLSEIASLLKKSFGISVHVSTLHRWRNPGVGGRRLNCSRVGGRWFTSLDSVLEFIDAGAVGHAAPSAGRRAAAAQDELETVFGMTFESAKRSEVQQPTV